MRTAPEKAQPVADLPEKAGGKKKRTAKPKDQPDVCATGKTGYDEERTAQPMVQSDSDRTVNTDVGDKKKTAKSKAKSVADLPERAGGDEKKAEKAEKTDPGTKKRKTVKQNIARATERSVGAPHEKSDGDEKQSALKKAQPVADLSERAGSDEKKAAKTDKTDLVTKKRKTVKRNVARLNAAIRKAVNGFKPPEMLTVSQWADKKRRLSAESSAETGAWRTSRTPYLKEIMDAFTDPRVRHISIVASSQVGKSETLNNMIGYAIDQDPSSILFIHPTTIDAKEYSKLRIAPMIRDCPTLRRKVADPKSRDSGNTITQKSYPGGILTMCGSTEAHALASKPIRYVFGDERDRWATSAGDEGDPWLLATARQITFYNAKSVECSTPTIKGASAIEKSYVKGTMERYKSRCPHCGGYHEIRFDDIRFEYNEIETKDEITYDVYNICYVCPGCGGVSTESEIKRAPARWEAENPDAYRLHGTRSFWLTSWVSPWASWSSTIVMFLDARGDSKKMQVVYNTRFGRLWEDRGNLEDEDTVMARRENYGTKPDGTPVELPEGVLYLTMGVDTQDDRLEYEVIGYGHFGESWKIRRGRIMGRPSSDDVWEALDEAINRRYQFADGHTLRVGYTFIDEGGHYTQDVRLRCRERLARKVFAIKGRAGDGIPYTSTPKKVDIVVDGRYIGKCWCYEIGVDSGKQQIMDNLRVQEPGPNYMHIPRRDEYDRQYYKGLLSERMVYDPKRKHPWHWEKIPGHERNEPLDMTNYANAAFKAAAPDLDAKEKRLRELRLGKKTPHTAQTSAAPASSAARPTRSARKDPLESTDW